MEAQDSILKPNNDTDMGYKERPVVKVAFHIIEACRMINEQLGVIPPDKGVTPSAIRFWEREGIIPHPLRYGSHRGRRFSESDIGYITAIAMITRTRKYSLQGAPEVLRILRMLKEGKSVEEIMQFFVLQGINFDRI